MSCGRRLALLGPQHRPHIPHPRTRPPSHGVVELFPRDPLHFPFESLIWTSPLPTPQHPHAGCRSPLLIQLDFRPPGFPFIVLNFLDMPPVRRRCLAVDSSVPSLLLPSAATGQLPTARGASWRSSPSRVTAKKHRDGSSPAVGGWGDPCRRSLKFSCWHLIDFRSSGSDQWPWIIVHISGPLRMIGVLWDLSL